VEVEEEKGAEVEGAEEEDIEEEEEGRGAGEEEKAVLLVPMPPCTLLVLPPPRLSTLSSPPSLPPSFPPSFPSSSPTTSMTPDSSNRRIRSPFSRQPWVDIPMDSHRRFSSIVDLPFSSPGLTGVRREEGREKEEEARKRGVR